MPKVLSTWINQHEFPKVYFRFPALLSLQWLTNRVLYHRSWLIRRTINRTLKQLPNNFSYLDAGCGAGDFLVPFAKKYPTGKFTGLDKTPSNIGMIDHYCQQKRIANVKLIATDLQEMGKEGRFSVVLCASVLHYVSDRQAVLRKFSENMISGGRLLIYVPVNYRRRIPGYEWLRENLFSKEDYEKGKPVSMNLSYREISGELAASGFRIESHQYLYGPAGQLAYEITSLSLLIIKKVPWIFSILGTLIYFSVIHPFMLALMGWDYSTRYKQGNGLLVTAMHEGLR
jgi:SAM-dependent methyltransferase